MKNNKKLGQAIIEYVMLLIIPVLIITVLPSLNETVEMTINTVGVDLMETEREDGSVLPPTPQCTNPNGCDPEPILLYPPVAKFELPTYCNNEATGTEQRGVYRKGATIRIQDLSYDTDPNGEGKIDHGEWTVQKYDVNGQEIEACSTVLRDSTIHTSRAANYGSEYMGLTISMNGYGGLTQYANCVRDPGSFKVTLRVFDNDGLLSKNIHTETFEIRDLRPSIKVSAETESNAESSATYVSELSQSDGCRFDTPLTGNNEQYGVPRLQDVNETAYVEFDDKDYPYIEVCPRDTNTGKDGKVTFRIESASANNFLADPDFTATDNAGTNDAEKVPEGAEDILFNYQRHGFTYKSRYIQSSATDEDEVSDGNTQVILFEDGAATYIKEFENPGLYIYDAQVFDENLISAQTVGTRTKNDFIPDVGVAIKVLSKLEDPEYYIEQCGDKPPVISCEKPEFLIGITKSTLNKEEEQGPFYFKIGSVGDDPTVSNFRDENGSKITLSTIAQLRTGLEMDVLERTYTYSNDDVGTSSVTIPIFRPTVDEHLSIKGLTYFPDSDYEECQPATTSRYWTTSNGWLNNFDFKKLKSGTDASWNAGEDEGSDWFEIQRPYDENNPLIYYNAENISDMTKGASFKDDKGNEIEHLELIFGMARNLSAERDFGDVIASPFNGKINSLGDIELFNGTKLNGDTNEEVEYEDSAVRSNGHLIAIAPVEQSCPTHDLRPVPKFSYISENNTIIPLTGQLKGVEPDTNTSITWNIDTKNPPDGITCIPEGCFVTVTSADSTCGEGADNCNIRAVRWEYSMYTHTPIPGSGALTEEDIENATFTPPNSNLVRKFPLNGTIYPKYDSIFYPKNQEGNYDPSTMDSTEDDVYSLPINDYSGSYIYYGEYNTTAEINEEKGQRITNTPTFNFVQRNDTISNIRNSGTTAPNAIATYTDYDHPDIPPETTSSGMFLQAGSSYQYNIEVIDSQGCATSRTLTINISDATKEPIPVCNFISQTITKEQLASYGYYGGLLVQGRSATSGYSALFQNGDNIVNGEDITLYTSPIYAFVDFTRYVDGEKATYSHDYKTSPTYFEREVNFSTSYEPEGIIPQEELKPGDFNPRYGQISVGGNLYGILDAENSKLGDGISSAESAEILNNPSSGTKIEWKLFKAEFDMKNGYATLEDLLADVVELENGIEGVYGLNLVKSEENPTPIETVYTTNLTEAPPFSANAFKEKGYYIIELSISYTKDGQLFTSSPTNCNLRVSVPTLDFKCPWGETYEELRNNALKIKTQIKNGSTVVTPSDDIFSVLTDENNYTKTNKNPYITDFEFTSIINKDYNNLDSVESSKPSYANTVLLSFKPNVLNDKWHKLKTNGGYFRSMMDNYVSACETAECDGQTVHKLEEGWLLSTDVYNAIKDSPTLNPLTITVNGHSETMSLQGWILRERYKRDGVLETHDEPQYLSYLNEFMSYEQISKEVELLRTPFASGVEEILDDTLMEIGNKIFEDLYNLRSYKMLLSSKFENSLKQEFTFMDLQPAGVSYTSGFSIVGESQYSPSLFKYTGRVKSSEGLVTETGFDASKSIRKGNIDFSGVYGSVTSQYTTYISTPFMGKYEAAKRFENLNQSDFAGQTGFITSNTTRNNKFDIWTEDNYLYAPFYDSYKNYYINPFSVYVNNVGQTDSLYSVPASSNADFSSLTGYSFDSMPATLTANDYFLETSNTYEYNVDRTTLNAVTWDHNFKLGRYKATEKNSPNYSSISYIRVNSADKNTILRESENATNGIVYNNYSKLCPIMVQQTDPGTTEFSSCNIGYKAPVSNEFFQPNPKTGIMTKNGQNIDNNFYPDGVITVNNTANEVSNIPMPKIYIESYYNLADIHIDKEKEKDFIIQNDGVNIYKAKYVFYEETNSGPREIDAATFDIYYDLANKDLSNNTVVDNLVNDVYNQFEEKFYVNAAGGDYRTKVSTYISPTTSLQSSTIEDGQIKFEINPIYYRVEYYTSETDRATGPNNTAYCTLYTANEIEPDIPLGGQGNPFVLEIGSWDYRIQFPNSSVLSTNKYDRFWHWDRTYDYNYRMSTGKMKQLNPPNAACKWETYPSARDNSLEHREEGVPFVSVAKKGAPKRLYGGVNNAGENGGCLVAGSSGHERIGMTELHEAQSDGIASAYSIVGDPNSPGWNSTTDNYAGFYVTRLHLLSNTENTTDKNYVKNSCYKLGWEKGKGAVFTHAIDVTNGSDINENGSYYWCSAGTLYALTDRNHRIEGLNGTQVIEVIMNNNGNTAVDASSSSKAGGYGLWKALNEQVTACYGKAC